MSDAEKFKERLKYGQAPDVCISFKRKPETCRFPDDHSYRVTGWMKMVDPEVMKENEAKYLNDFSNMLNDLLIDTAQKHDGKLMVHCTREEATHVTGAGIAGCIVSINDIVCGDYVKWDKETIDKARENALRSVGEYVD